MGSFEGKHPLHSQCLNCLIVPSHINKIKNNCAIINNFYNYNAKMFKIKKTRLQSQDGFNMLTLINQVWLKVKSLLWAELPPWRRWLEYRCDARPARWADKCLLFTCFCLNLTDGRNLDCPQCECIEKSNWLFSDDPGTMKIIPHMLTSLALPQQVQCPQSPLLRWPSGRSGMLARRSLH